LAKRKKSITLLELIVVIVILAILAILSLPRFGKIKEHSIEKEAIANLKLIQAAEKIYKLEMVTYISGSVTADLNSALRLALPTTSPYYWDYKVVDSSGSAFTAKAQRTTVSGGSTSTVKCLDQDDAEPSDCTW
jgi:type II secretory pathway pseudopilin PulG